MPFFTVIKVSAVSISLAPDAKKVNTLFPKKHRSFGGIRAKTNIFQKCLTFSLVCDIIHITMSDAYRIFGGFVFMDDGDADDCQYTVIIE